MEPKNLIVIDGVDVSGCECFYINDSLPEYKECINIYCKGLCKDNPNCHYKQFKRKERECQRTEQKLTLIRDFITDTQIYNMAQSICDKILQIIDEVTNE